MNFDGERLAELREDKGLSQKELAEKLNISRDMLSRYERGKNSPSDQIKMELVELLGVSLDYLFGLTEERKPFQKGIRYVAVPNWFPEDGKKKVEEYIRLLEQDYKTKVVNKRR